MSKTKELIENYRIDVQFPDVSGFEILEMLDLRSEIAERERDLSAQERAALEKADRYLIQNAHLFYGRISQVADLAEMRRRVNALPSHWWWYLDTLVEMTKVAA